MHAHPLHALAVACLLLPAASASAHSCVPSPRNNYSAVWTGTELIVWGGDTRDGPQADGARYDPAADRWTPMGAEGAPAPRSWHTAVWTGREMLVWGGVDRTGAFGNGARYDPAADTWTPMTTVGIPPARYLHSVAWTGKEMIVHGGNSGPVTNVELASGASYDPVADAWGFVPDAPMTRRLHGATWTGDAMLVQGGYHGEDPIRSGLRYDPAAKAWTPMSDRGAPFGHGTQVWTGKELFAWGSTTERARFDTAHRYDPATDTWSPVPAKNGLAGRIVRGSVWTGREVIAWGGFDDAANREASGGARFDVATGMWTAMTQAGAPSPRRDHTAAWTGTHMLVWGGYSQDETVNTGALYDPARDAWKPMSDLCTGHDH
jgi:hypothetical protein